MNSVLSECPDCRKVWQPSGKNIVYQENLGQAHDTSLCPSCEGAVMDISNITIEDGVKIPETNYNKRKKYQFLDEMKVSQSVFIPIQSEAADRQSIRVAQVAYRKNVDPDDAREFTVRQVTENGVKGRRIWRVK